MTYHTSNIISLAIPKYNRFVALFNIFVALYVIIIALPGTGYIVNDFMKGEPIYEYTKIYRNTHKRW